MRAREAWGRVALVGLGLGVALVASELALSLLMSPGNDGSPAPRRRVPADQVAASTYHPAPWYMQIGDAAVNMHTVIEPFTAEQEFGYRHNSHGFRTPEYTLARPPNAFRVIVVGDSCTWGQGVALNNTFHRRLEGLLRERLARRGLQAEVIGLGVRGSRFVDNLLRLLVHGAQLEPDVVVIQFYPNDLELYEPYSWQVRFQKIGRGPALLRLLRFAEERWKGSYWRRLEQVYDKRSRDWRVFEGAMRKLDRWRDKHSGRVVFLALPLLDCGVRSDNFNCYADEEAHLPLLRHPLRDMVRHGYPVIDIARTFAEEAGERYLCVSPSDGHPNSLAHKLMATALARRLGELGWLDIGPKDGGRAGRGWMEENRLRADAARRWATFNRNRAAQLVLFDALLALHPRDAWLTAQAAYARCMSGDTPRGRDLFGRLVALEPRYAAPWYDLAQCGAEDGTKEHYLKLTLRHIPDQSNAVESLIDLYLATDRLEQACQAAARLAKIASYPEQYERARDMFSAHGCARFGLGYAEGTP